MAEFKVSGKDLLRKIEELIHQGNIRRIIIKDADGKVFMEIPLTIGVLGTIAAPVFAAIGAIAGLVANFRIEVIKAEDDENVSDATIIEDESE